MTAIYKRELSSYFNSMIGYVFIAVLVFFTGIYFMAYNLFNWFRRVALPARMRKHQLDTIRLKLMKVAARVVRSARYKYFKLCSSCPYKKEFYETLDNIHKLQLQP